LYGHKELNKLFIGITAPPASANNKERAPLSPDWRKGEAVIHYLNNSGFAIETANHLLVFDYYHFYPAPDDPSLSNGRINPDELKGKKVVVFASHEHGDHYDTTIWNWGTGNSGIRYVMGFKPDVRHRYDYADPHSELKFDGITINPIRSTDSGEGFLVETDGIVIYHPGDHINKESGLAADFKGEIDYLAALNKSVDIAFFPVNGCGFPDAGIVKTGNIYVIETLNPRLCIAMHAGDHECKAFIAGIEPKFPGKQTASGTFPGDCFIYLKEQPE
jgi:L-ascorbate metabolism protein UlaG (beta-lactamase superfamily)